MSNQIKIIIAAAVVLVLVVGGFFIFNSNNDSNNSETSEQISNQAEQINNNGEGILPVAAQGPFVMKVTVTDPNDNGTNGTSEFKIVSNDVWELNGEANGTVIKMVQADGKIFLFNADSNSWQALPIDSFSNQENGVSANPSEYTFSQSDFDDFLGRAEYKGTQDCPAGSCDVYEITDQNVKGQDDIKVARLFIDKGSKNLSKFYFEDSTGRTAEITYVYGGNVEVKAPTENVQTLDIPNIPGVNTP